MKAGMLRYIPFLFAMVFAFPTALRAGHPNGIGMWVWSDASFSTDDARQRLVAFCKNHHINHLDIHVRITREDGCPTLPAEEAFRKMIVLAGQHAITTSALRGSPRMFFSQNHERTLREVKALIDFSKTLPSNNLFMGIKFDVEPYRTKEWKTDDTGIKNALLDYLTFLQSAKSFLDKEAPCLALAVDIPFWWDKDKFIVNFGGKSKRFNEHVQDLTDYIAVMSYRRSPQQVLNCVENEWRYARRVNKVIFTSLETNRLKQDQSISFWDLPDAAIWSIIPQLLEPARKDPAMGGVMIHSYRGLRAKDNDRCGALKNGENLRGL